MAIVGNRIAATTAKKDGLEGTPPPVCSKVAPVAPPASYYDSNAGATVLQPAEYEGQVRAVERQPGESYALYVVVNTAPSGQPETLEWKLCAAISGYLDSRTGLPYDPLADFYNVLAN